MDSLSTALLIFVGVVAFNNYRHGNLGTWLKAKFLNSADPSSSPSVFDTSVSASVPAGNATGLGGAQGNLLWPVTGPITSNFGENRGTHLHSGLDIASPSGTPIKAARAGTVTYAGASGDYGLRVDVNNGGGGSELYAHLSRMAVGVGQHVNAGDVVGYVGATGDATGPHLHFELRQNGSPVNPSPYLPAGLVA